MGFFDKVTKAVGDAVDKGKKDIDQFMRIQKINGEITAIEAKVVGLKAEIQQNSQAAGQKAIELLRAGSFSNPELQVFVEKLAAIEQNIAAEQAAIVTKKADIERVKAEDEAPVMPPPPLPVPPAAGDVAAASIVPPPLPPAAACPQCGKPLTGGAFCTECGAKVG